jgi:tellurite resistance protein TehA-like permease
VRIARNVAIILLLALALTVLPAGSNVAQGILVALSVLFAVAIGGLLIRYWKQTSLQRDTLTDRQRLLIYGPAGAIALMIAGADEMLATGPGTAAWVVILVGSGWLIFNTWREAQSI